MFFAFLISIVITFILLTKVTFLKAKIYTQEKIGVYDNCVRANN